MNLNTLHTTKLRSLLVRNPRGQVQDVLVVEAFLQLVQLISANSVEIPPGELLLKLLVDWELMKVDSDASQVVAH